MTDEELQERLGYWQKRLRLADWHIEAEMVRPHRLDPNTKGVSAFKWEKKAAHIMVLPTGEYDSNWIVDSPVDDEEYTLVHELLHCTFAGFWKERGWKSDLQHQAIHAIAVALIEEHRLSSDHATVAA